MLLLLSWHMHVHSQLAPFKNRLAITSLESMSLFDVDGADQCKQRECSTRCAEVRVLMIAG